MADAPRLQSLRLEFSGGCELLFRGQSSIAVADRVPTGTTLDGLVLWIRDHLAPERPELFLTPALDALRPGILALVNDADAEVLGGGAYVVQEDDVVTFISTLHGG